MATRPAHDPETDLTGDTRVPAPVYKYIIFDAIPDSTGKVYDLPCHRIMNKNYQLPNTDWIAGHHWCVPLYYKGE